jgi:prepilin-type N-terminal cleavage/methylation domain-containing protein
MRRYRRRNGFTLVEMLVALAIFGTVMAGISIVFLSSLRAWHASRETQSVFEMGRAALRVMEQDITTAFGSVERGELRTLVGGPDWLSFVGITENPKTAREPGWTPTAHSDIARITYCLMSETAGSDENLLLRLVQLDVDDVGVDPVELWVVTDRTVDEWNAIVGTEVVPTDFELGSNILALRFSYGLARPDVNWEGVREQILWNRALLLNETDPLVREQIRTKIEGFWDDTMARYDFWDSRARTDRKLPDAIAVELTVRAAAKIVIPGETKERVFGQTIFLPLGYRRPLPAALQ